jgi:hypothetical protein
MVAAGFLAVNELPAFAGLKRPGFNRGSKRE